MTTQVCTGSFVNVASQPYFLPLHQQINEFRLYNLTRSGVTVGSTTGNLTTNRIVEAYFNPSYMNMGTALIKQNGTVAAGLAPLGNGNLAQNGFQVILDTGFPTQPVVALASFTPGTPTVFTTSTAHGYQVGDTVRIYGLTSAPQFSGLLMTVTAVGSTTTFTTLLNSTGAATSVGSVVKVGNYLLPTTSLYYPQNRVIASMTNANPMVITTLVQQNYFVGDVVTFDVPTVFGVPQLTNQYRGLPVEATVIASNNAVGTQTVTLALNSIGFGVFGGTNGWPGATSYPFGSPIMVPQGEGNINNFQQFNITPAPLPYANQNVLSFARQNLGSRGILIGAGDGTNATNTGGIIGATADVWSWEAVTAMQTFP